MGFTGRPSVGCATCKQRKKKCDRTKPLCYKCTSTGRVCPGVPDEVDVLFRNEFASSNGYSDRGLRRNQVDQSLNQSNVGSKILSSTKLVAEKPAVYPGMPTDWLTTATTYYLNLHFQKDLLTRRLNPWLELQSKFFTSAKPDTGLSLAVGAFAALTMAEDLQMPGLCSVANVAYGRALRAIKGAISDPGEALKDEVAVGVFAVTSYELKQQDALRFRRYRTHLAGMRQLLIMRGRSQLANFESLKVFRALRIQIVYDYMLRGIPLIDEGDEAIWTNSSPYNASPVDDLCAVAALIPGLRVKAKEFVKTPAGLLPEDILNDAFKVNEKLDRWVIKWDDHVKYEIVTTGGSADTGWQGRTHTYTDLSLAVLMNHYYLLRIVVLETLLATMEACDIASKEINLKRSDVLSQLHDFIDNMCFSISFITTQVRDKGQKLRGVPGPQWKYPSQAEATWILLPIVTTMMQKSIGKQQQTWLKQQLVHLNLEFGLIDASSLPRGSGERLKASSIDT